MTPPPLIDDAGRAVALGPMLAQGGEGAVFPVPADPSVVAKVYHTPPSPQTAEKLAAMVRLGNSTLQEVAAWPTRILRHAGTKEIVGFVMPRLTDFQPLQHLYNPVMRLKHFPRAGWAFQFAAAANLAAAFEEVHKTGCLVGDVNQSNAFVSGTALVRLIDCDSFQVPRAGQSPFRCEVGTPHYTPPELQGKSLRGVVRTENHDRFGLAVLIYQLLFVGRHPYAGIYRGAGDPSFEQLIEQYRFAQGPQAHTWGMSPPPHTPTFADIPPEVGELFRRAFERGGENNRRPTAAEWDVTLKRLRHSLTTCSADGGHQYWMGRQPHCVWCRLAEGGGPEYFFGVASGGGTFAVDEARLQQAMARLAAVAIPPEVPLPRFHPHRYTPRPLPDDLEPLRRDIETTEAERDVELSRRRAVELRELEAIGVQERSNADGKRAEFRRLFAKLDREVSEAAVAVRLDRKRHGAWQAILVVGFAFGVVALPFGFVKQTIGWASGTVVLVSVTGLIVCSVAGLNTQARRTLAAARRRRDRAEDLLDEAIRGIRQQANEARAECERVTARIAQQVYRPVDAAKRRFRSRCEQVASERVTAIRTALARRASLEREWASAVQNARRRYSELATRISATVSEARSLAAEFARDSQHLATTEEALARTRHLRLHSLADAEIPLIGATRLQDLATNAIVTAADVDRHRILRIWGFGPVLVENLVAWRDAVMKQFRFDPARDVSPAEKQALVVRYQSRHHQLLTRLDEACAELERLSKEHRGGLDAIEMRLRTANAEYQQAEADHLLISGLL